MQCDCCSDKEAILECPECQDDSGKAKSMCEECSQAAHKTNWRSQKHRVYYFAIKEQQIQMKDWPAEWKRKRQNVEQRMKEMDEANNELRCRQGILEQQVKDEVMRLQQKLKQRGIEMIQKLKADTNEKMDWFKEFKGKSQEVYDSIYNLEKEINELVHPQDIEGFPEKFTAVQEQTQTITCDMPTMEGTCPRLVMMTDPDCTGLEAEIGKLYSDVDIITAPLTLTEKQSPLDEVGNEVFASLQSNVTASGLFWLQPELLKETFSQLLNISYCIRTAYLQASNWQSYGEMNEAPKFGDICYARNPSDRKWYRSSALEPSQRMPNETNVRFLDFGNQHHIRNHDILPLKEDIEVPNIPYQAMECTLYEEEKNFKMDLRWALVDLVKSERLKCKFLGKVEQEGRTVNHVDLFITKPDGSELSVRDYMDKKLEENAKPSGGQPFASRDIRLLEDPHMFDKPKKEKERESRETEKTAEPNWRERRARNRSDSRSRRQSKPNVMKDGVVDLHELAKLALPVSRRNSDATPVDSETEEALREVAASGSADNVSSTENLGENIAQKEDETDSIPKAIQSDGQKIENKDTVEEEEEFFDAQEEKDETEGAAVSSEAVSIGVEATEATGDETVKTDIEPEIKEQNHVENTQVSQETESGISSDVTVPPISLENDETVATTTESCDKVEETVPSQDAPSESLSGQNEVSENVVPAEEPVESAETTPRSDATEEEAEQRDSEVEQRDPEAEAEYQRQRAKYYEEDKVYGLPNYSRTPGEFMQLTIDNPLQKDGSFWACYACVNDQEKEQFEQFHADLEASADYTTEYRNPEKGTIIMAYFKKKWGRSRVLEVDERAKCKVRFVDTGISARVPRHCLKHLPSSFIHTAHQAVHCTIFQGDISNFSREAVRKFGELVKEGKEVTAEVLQTNRDLICVQLTLQHAIDDPVDINHIVYEEEKNRKGKRTPRSSPRQDGRYGYGSYDQEMSPQVRGPPKILQPVMQLSANPQLYQRQMQGHPSPMGTPQRGPVMPHIPQQYPGALQCESFGFNPGAGPVVMMPAMGQTRDGDTVDWSSDGDTNILNGSASGGQCNKEPEESSRAYTGGDVRLDQAYQCDGMDGWDQQNGEQRNSGSPGDVENSGRQRDDGYSGRRDGEPRRWDDRYDGGPGRQRDNGYDGRRDGYGGQRDGYGGQRDHGYRRDNRQGGRRNDRRRSHGNSWGGGNKGRRSSYEPGQPRTCYNCGDIGHMKRDCPNAQQ